MIRLLKFILYCFGYRWLWAKRNRRLIFKFHNGVEWVYGDPLDIQRKLELHPKYNARVHPKLAENGDYEALQIVDQAIQDCFGVPPLDPKTGKGLPLNERLVLLIRFGDWMEQKKNSISQLPMPRSSMGSISGKSTGKTTTASSDSAKTSPESKPDEPTSSGEESPPESTNQTTGSRHPQNSSSTRSKTQPEAGLNTSEHDGELH